MAKIAIINGPNLNMLKVREKGVYGNKSLEQINNELKKIADQYNLRLSFFQSNHQGEIVDYIQQNFKEWDGLIINPAGLTTTSVVLRDAILILDIPIIEVHLSNIYAREKFRQKSLLRDLVLGQVCGLGDFSYTAALYYFIKIFNKGEDKSE